MPILLALAALIPSATLLVKSTGEEAKQAVNETGTNVVLIAAAGLGLFAAFKVIQRGRL